MYGDSDALLESVFNLMAVTIGPYMAIEVAVCHVGHTVIPPSGPYFALGGFDPGQTEPEVSIGILLESGAVFRVIQYIIDCGLLQLKVAERSLRVCTFVDTECRLREVCVQVLSVNGPSVQVFRVIERVSPAVRH